MRRLTWCGRWILPESPAATCGIACSISCAITRQLAAQKNGNGEATAQVLADAIAIVDQHLRALQNKQYKEIARTMNRTPEAMQEAWTISGPSIPVPVCATTRASPG